MRARRDLLLRCALIFWEQAQHYGKVQISFTQYAWHRSSHDRKTETRKQRWRHHFPFLTDTKDFYSGLSSKEKHFLYSHDAKSYGFYLILQKKRRTATLYFPNDIFTHDKS